MKKLKRVLITLGILALLVVTYLILDNVLFTGVKPVEINKNGIQANFYAQTYSCKKTTLVLLGGGQWGDYWGQTIAQNGFVGLSLPYVGKEGLPHLPEEIELEYFEQALEWLRKQPEVDPKKIVVMGASRNAELALLLGATFNDLVSGVIAYAPSSVSWSNTVLPYNSDQLKPSWTFKGNDIPYIAMTKISGNPTSQIETLSYWEKGLSDTNQIQKALIKVEQIKGPILLLSGKDDKVWPSALMADMIEQQLVQHHFAYPFQNIKYEQAGHHISSNPKANSKHIAGNLYIEGKKYKIEYGGNEQGNNKAKRDAKKRVIDFVRKM